MPKVVLKDVLPCLGHASQLMLNCRYLLNKIMLENAKQPTAYIFSFYHPIIQHFTEIQAYIKPTWGLHCWRGWADTDAATTDTDAATADTALY